MGRGRSSSGSSSRGGSSSSGGRGYSRSSRYSSRSSSNSSVVFISGGHHGSSSGSPWVGIVVGAMFVLTGLFCIVSGFVNLVTPSSYATTSAICVDNDYQGGWYYTTYEYSVEGAHYVNKSSEGWEYPEDEGKVVTIYYLKSDPNIITEENPNDKGEAAVFFVVGLIITGMGSLPIAFCVKELKQKKLAKNTFSQETVEEVKEEKHIKCNYCKSKYSKDLTKCPHCGAGRQD